MKKTFHLAFLLFSILFLGQKNAVAVVGNSTQLVENERLTSKSQSLNFSKYPEESPATYPADRMAKWGFWLGIFGWTMIVIQLFGVFPIFFSLIMIAAFVLGMMALKRRTIYRKKALAATIFGAAFFLFAVMFYVFTVILYEYFF